MINFDFTWIITAISMTASFLNIKKKVVCFYLWAISVMLCLIIDVKTQQYGRAFLDFFCLGVNVYGIVTWTGAKTTTTTEVTEVTEVTVKENKIQSKIAKIIGESKNIGSQIKNINFLRYFFPK